MKINTEDGTELKEILVKDKPWLGKLYRFSTVKTETYPVADNLQINIGETVKTGEKIG